MPILNEYESKQLLKKYGINIPDGKIATNVNQVHDIANSINAENLVLKIVSNDIIHKSDCGGVKINIPNDKLGTVNIEYYHMMEDMKTKFPNAKIDGIYLQEMIKPGIECIIGIKEDPQFGKVIIFGFGGIYTEIFKDISMRILPVTKDDIKEMISETKIYKILNGARGKVYEIKSLIDTIMKIIQLSEKYNIQEMDINPLVVQEKKCVALDVRVLI